MILIVDQLHQCLHFPSSSLNSFHQTVNQLFLRLQNNYFSVMHLHVKTKVELEDALLTSQDNEVDCVIEVESCIDANATFHRFVVTLP